MIPWSKGLKSREFARMWLKDFLHRLKRSADVGVQNTDQSAGVMVGGFCPRHQDIERNVGGKAWQRVRLSR